MGIRVRHDAFHTGPGAYRLHDNLVSWIVDFNRKMQQAFTIVIKKLKTEFSTSLYMIARRQVRLLMMLFT